MRVVVAAAVVSADGRLLVAQRAHPAALAGRWELPGGKVDPGEDEVVALRRECREELDVDLAVGARVGGDLPTVGGDMLLRVWWARVAAGVPVAREHRALRWVGADELDALDWLDADRPLVPVLRTGLSDPRHIVPPCPHP